MIRNFQSDRTQRLLVVAALAMLASLWLPLAGDLVAQEAVVQTTNAAQTAANESGQSGIAEMLDVQEFVSPQKVSGTFKTILLLAVISLVPAIAMMTTSFVRIVIVLGILRQALGAQQIPSTQIVTALALFMSFLIMTPVWNEIKTQAIDPYTDSQTEMTLQEAWEKGSRPIKSFMSRQIVTAGNVDDIWLFYQHLPKSQRQQRPEKFDDIPIQVLLPAFMISELKIAFLIGFQVLMPFLIIDLVVTSVTTSLGMIMLPPTMVSLPLKLIMFVLLDGWNLIVGMLLQSFSPYL